MPKVIFFCHNMAPLPEIMRTHPQYLHTARQLCRCKVSQLYPDECCRGKGTTRIRNMLPCQVTRRRHLTMLVLLGLVSTMVWWMPVRKRTIYCPPCDALFSRLKTDESGRRVQYVNMQERGEPKCGTKFMFDWAHGALLRTCDVLDGWYGGQTCHLEKQAPTGEQLEDPEAVTLIFDPNQGGGDHPCSCHNVDRVEIRVTNLAKHRLPVARNCAWFHPNGLSKAGDACKPADGRALEGYADLWRCMKEAACHIEDDNLQFVSLRDPRAVAVSTYFHVQRFPKTQGGQHPALGESLDKAVLSMLPQICQWVALRHILFAGLMANRSVLFWYEEALDDPIRWHHQWLASVGLHLPSSIVTSISDAAVGSKYDFMASGLDQHPGGINREGRSWRDEVTPALLESMDEIVRIWLPPVLLARLGIAL